MSVVLNLSGNILILIGKGKVIFLISNRNIPFASETTKPLIKVKIGFKLTQLWKVNPQLYWNWKTLFVEMLLQRKSQSKNIGRAELKLLGGLCLLV